MDWRVLTFWLAILGCALAAEAFILGRRARKKDRALQRNLRVLQSAVRFLESINALPPALSLEQLQSQILRELREALEPFHVHPRLWLADQAWKTLYGLGDHPALRPGSPNHLPMSACPAFARRESFHYAQNAGDPCPTEQFNYGRHLCVPLMNNQDCYGILFLGAYQRDDWDADALHLFDMLAHAMALKMHRRALFDTLQEKISELHFSFEVGAATLATFGGSTQSIDETTVHILDSVIAILRVDRASLMLWDAQSQTLTTQWVRGGNFKVQSPIQLKRGQGMAGWALQTGEPYWAEYAMGDPHYAASAQPIRSLLCVPVYTQDRQPLGVINAVTLQTPRAFLAREIDFLNGFGRQAALAIENARLHHKSRANIDQLSELSKLKSQFLSLVSHDLRGPLTGIRGFCEVLKQAGSGTLDGKQAELVDSIQRQVDLQERMVDDLLDLARMEKGRLSIQPARTDLAALLQEEISKSQLEARERKVALSCTLDLGPAPTWAMIDGGRIRQVVWNLIHNALKFTPEGGRVAVRALTRGQSVCIDVEDTGVGLEPHTQERVFDKFFQISPGGSKSAQGLGLGLTICKEIIAAHGGQIRARSPGLGLGTTISFSLPLSNSASQSDQTSAAA